MDDYLHYAEIFNTGNDELLVSTFFAFPFTFTTPFVNQRFETEEEFVHQLKIVRQPSRQEVPKKNPCPYVPTMYLTCWPAKQYHRVRECIDPQQVTYGKQKVFVNLDIVFHSCVEWLDFAYGPVRPGDMLIVSGHIVLALCLAFLALSSRPRILTQSRLGHLFCTH